MQVCMLSSCTLPLQPVAGRADSLRPQQAGRQAEAQGEGRAVASECCQCPVPCDANRKQRHKGKAVSQAGRLPRPINEESHSVVACIRPCTSAEYSLARSINSQSFEWSGQAAPRPGRRPPAVRLPPLPACLCGAPCTLAILLQAGPG